MGYLKKQIHDSKNLYFVALFLSATLFLPDSLFAKSKTSSISETDLSERKALDNDLTRRIQIDLITNENLESNPKYIHIVTVDGGLTLQGHVTSSAEKKKIEKIAKKIIGAKEIDNQLEVGE